MVKSYEDATDPVMGAAKVAVDDAKEKTGWTMRTVDMVLAFLGEKEILDLDDPYIMEVYLELEAKIFEEKLDKAEVASKPAVTKSGHKPAFRK